IHAYATTLADTRPEADRGAPLDRLYDHYAHTTARAAALAYPYDAEHLLRPPQAATPAPPLPDPAAAAARLAARHANPPSATAPSPAAHAPAHPPEHLPHHSDPLPRHLNVRGHSTDADALHQHALTAAQATGDHAAQVTPLNHLGRIRAMQGRYDSATDCLTR